MSLVRSAWPAVRRAVVISIAMTSAIAQASPAEDAEQSRLVQERAAIDATYSARVNECQRRFVVTSCVEDAKRDRRHGLDALRSRQITIDELRRTERSAARRSELSALAAEQARRESERAARPAARASEPVAVHDEPTRSLEPRRSSMQRASGSKRPAARASGAEPGTKGSGAAERTASEGRSRATFAARQRQAAEHREGVVEKAAKRARQHRPAAPLPIPSEIKPAP
ncbi:MAG: hypothetical protein ABIZ18_15270 [Caldimonas sp.]